MAAFAGFAFGNRPRLAGMFVTVPVVGIALAAVRLVPLGDRLALWIVPSLLFGVVLLFNRGVELVAAGSRSRRPLRLTAGAFVLACAAWVAGDVAAEGYRQLDLGLPTDTNHALDDKRAVRWLMDAGSQAMHSSATVSPGPPCGGTAVSRWPIPIQVAGWPMDRSCSR